MGAVATVWIFSGNWMFSFGFMLQAILAQLEYYRMAMQKGGWVGRVDIIVVFHIEVDPCVCFRPRLGALAPGNTHTHTYLSFRGNPASNRGRIFFLRKQDFGRSVDDEEMYATLLDVVND